MSNSRGNNNFTFLAKQSLKKTGNIVGLIFITQALLFWNGCSKKSAEDEISYPLETAKLVSQVTSGFVPPDGEIRVRFVSRIIKDNLVGQSVKKEVFTFEPEIDGVARWLDSQTLVFVPNQVLPLRQKYNGALLVADLLPLHKEKKLEPLRFRFEVTGREISKVETDFQLEDPQNPRRLLVTGNIEFTENADLPALRDAASLKKDKRRIKLNWQGESPGKRFSFTSAAIERTEKESAFLFVIDKDALEISENYQKKFSLTPLSDLAVHTIKQQEGGDRPGIIVEFSDELDPRQDITGLISVIPQTDSKLKRIGKNVYISGSFKHGASYTVNISQGVRSRWGTVTEQEFSQSVMFDELKPQLKFSSDGVFLPTVNDRTIRFMTLNLRKVRVEIKRVFENNLGQFLQTEKLSSDKTRNDRFNGSYVNRVGLVVRQDYLEIGEVRNQWTQQELDLSNIIDLNDENLYIISISFQQEDMLYGDPAKFEEYRRNYYYGDDYYSNPYSRGYFYNHGHIYKPVIVSDIGLTYKKTHDRHIIYATDIKTARPLSGVKVTLKTYQNQVIAVKTTGSDGRVIFSRAAEKVSNREPGRGVNRLRRGRRRRPNRQGNIQQSGDKVFYVEARYNNHRSVVKLNEMRWNYSTFDTDGVNDVPGGVRAFIYTERGVYRPGDPVNISIIARNDDQTFPDNHPITIKIYNPKNQKAFEQTSSDGQDGFYNFTFQSSMDDPTGNWRVDVLAGSRTFHHTLKIETVVPFRLKVKLAPEKTPLTRADKTLKVKLSSNYLFGNPAAGLGAELQLFLKKQPKKFSKYKTFVFSNEAIDYRSLEKTIFKGSLDARGQANISWRLPNFDNAPSALMVRLNAKVFEKGGRPNTNFLNIPIDPYNFYVGLQKPGFDYGYAKIGAEVQMPVILVNTLGKAVAGKPLNYRIYKGMRYWWWEYDRQSDYRLRFKSHQSTELIKEGSLVSQAVPGLLKFIPQDRGTYLVEIQDGEEGHTAGVFMSAYAWGESGAGGKDAGVLTLKTDQNRYFIGDEARVTFPAPKEGSILVSIEKGKRVIESYWIDHDPRLTEVQLSVPITREMAPTAYASVSIIQPHAQTLNDRPLRMYGVVPLNVEDRKTRQKLLIKMPDELRSNESFKIDIETADGQPIQFTIAVVDEGLLDLTRFSTPDPWKHFFQKLRLGVETYDLFNFFIGANKGDVLNVFSIGGGLAEKYRESQLDSGKKKRFKAVSMFKGPIMTDANGKASLEFDMPNYVGSVRVMVSAARQNRYGHTEKTAPVKTELMALPTLPRVIGPDDKFIIPVTVFAMQDNIGKVEVSLSLEGPLQSAAAGRQTLNFSKSGEEDVFFTIHADTAVGQAKVTIRAKSANFTSAHVTDIEVRASSPRIYDAEDKTVEPGSSVTFTVPNRGIPGSNHAAISIRRRPNLNLSGRLMRLIRYPYGCIEQNISAVFPQLYLKDFFRDEGNLGDVEKQIDNNINRGVKRLRSFQLPSGAFAYWPGSVQASQWGTSYAGHFLIEAKKRGYHVPDDLYKNWLRYQQSMALNTQKNLMVRVHRVYLLSLAGEPSLAAMNLLRENNLKDMTDTQKWLTAGSYKLAGLQNVALDIAKKTGTKVRDYWEFGNTYGSTLRDKAIILDMQTTFENWNTADELADELCQALSDRNWYSTQTTGYMLLAVGKYLEALEGKSQNKPRLAGSIIFPNGQKESFDTGELTLEYPIKEGFGKTLTVNIGKKSTAKRVFTTLSWDGIPLKSDVADEQKNLGLKVEWLDEDGMAINPDALTQGTTFWGHYVVSNPQSRYGRIEELALVQALPSGWEIENTRLSGEDRPSWMSRWRINSEEYLDVRDDRVMWFFDLNYRKALDFVVKLNAVTIGDFQLPATLLEAMYNDNYKATKAGRAVKVMEK